MPNFRRSQRLQLLVLTLGGLAVGVSLRADEKPAAPKPPMFALPSLPGQAPPASPTKPAAGKPAAAAPAAEKPAAEMP